MGTFAMRRAVPASRFQVQDCDAHQSFSGCGEAWYRASLGRWRSWVRIPPPRPIPIEDTTDR